MLIWLLGLDLKCYIINFELVSCHLLCVSLKSDANSLTMATLPIEKVDVLKIMSIRIIIILIMNLHGATYSYDDQLTTCCHQRLDAIFCVREYLGQRGLATAYS